jgi:hypothetical protein
VPDHDEEVGYGKPPKKTRFKKGQSGNPKGRPKGAKNLATIVADVCQERVRVKGENGRTYYLVMMEAIMKQLTNQAARGDMKATRMFFAILDMFPEIREPEPAGPPDMYVQFVRAKDGKPAPIEDNEELVTMPMEEWLKRPRED